MKEFRIKDMKWFLEDEGLSAILERLPEVTDARRHYVAVPYKDGKLFIKTFVEKGAVGALRNRTIPRGRKEYETGKRLASMAIRTPGCLGYGVGRNRSCVIQDWIDGEGFVHVFFRHGYRERLIPALAELIPEVQKDEICADQGNDEQGPVDHSTPAFQGSATATARAPIVTGSMKPMKSAGLVPTTSSCAPETVITGSEAPEGALLR